MESFTAVTGIAAPLPMINVDTDMIIPKQYLKTIRRTGLGAHLFDELRFSPDGAEHPDFVLNRAPYRRASILIALDNFGCGSSREHAPWALADFGFRCIVAPSFADIFFNNCVNNGILCVTLPKAEVETLLRAAGTEAGALLTVDLEAQRIVGADGSTHAFEIEPKRKERLLEGLDTIALTLRREDAIASFEERRRQTAPWL